MVLKSKSRLLFPLRPGDLIEIIAPGSGTPLEVLEQGAARLRSWGYRVQYDPDILQAQLYLAQSDEYRFQALKKALNNPKVAAIWCLRGGYGALRLLPALQKLKPPSVKKLLIGYSDVTSLHILLNGKWNWPSLHGPLIDRLAADFDQGSKALPMDGSSELRDCLSKIEYPIHFANLVALNSVAAKKVARPLRTEVVGGNLVVLNSSVGTKTQLNAKGKMLFLEEVGERGYRIDRCLQQMSQAGVFSGVRAVLLGDFINGLEKDGSDLVWPTLKKFFNEFKIPVVAGFPVGHGKIQRPLFFNTKSVLTCGSAPQMINYGPV